MSAIVRGTVLNFPLDVAEQVPSGWTFVEVPAWGADGSMEGSRGFATWAQLVSADGSFAMPDVGAHVILVRESVGDTPYIIGVVRPLGGFLPGASFQDTADGRPTDAMTPKADSALVAQADAAATAAGVPAELLRAIISRESAWRPKAYNRRAAGQQFRKVRSIPDHRIGTRTLKEHASFNIEGEWGAWGLGQVMLLTALESGLAFDALPASMKDPAVNLPIAARVLARFHMQAGEDPRWTAAMYHAGPGNVPSPDPAMWPSDTQRYSADVYAFWLAERAGGARRSTLPPTAEGADDESTSGMIKGTADASAPVVTAPVTGAVMAPSIIVSQPATMMAAEYPNNAVRRTPGGHLEELDDTPGARRSARLHPSGAFQEVGDAGQMSERLASAYVYVDGRRTERSGPRVDVVECDRRTHTGGRDVRTSATRTDKVDGASEALFGGDRKIESMGLRDHLHAGAYKLRVVGPATVAATELGLAGKAVRVLAVAGTAEVLGEAGVVLGSPITPDTAKRRLMTDTALVSLGSVLIAVATAIGLNAKVAGPEAVAAAGALTALVGEFETLAVSSLGVGPPFLTTLTRAD